jgi:hypothetical protein
MVRSVFVKISKIIKLQDFLPGTKIRILRCYIYRILLYVAETWILTETLSYTKYGCTIQS